MKARHLKLANEVGRAYARHLFETFQNPKYRGERFRWSNLPKIAEGMADAGVAMSCADWDRMIEEDRKSLKETAAKAASKHAKELLKKNPQCT